ncbi:MAG: glycosyltransferase, partial [Actinobacteria bacterium]|nr:glycosyltransferase [Actinomycetota bacterium]
MSIVIPVYNEGENVEPVLRRLFEVVDIEAEVLVVYDEANDTTIPALTKLQLEFRNLRSVQNTYGRGPANA